MAGKEISQKLKTALELGPVLLFFVGYFVFRGDDIVIGGESYKPFIVLTAAFVPLLLISIGVLWRLTGKVSRMQVLTAVLVIVFGGLTVWFNDERFFKMKPTVIYLFFAGALGLGLLRGQSYLAYVMENLLPLKHEGWMILTKRFALFFLSLAILNEVIWRFMSTGTWVSFKTFGLPVLIIGFMFAQGRLFEAFGIDEDDEGSGAA